ncbi:MAG: site-specific integrase, partial [Corallococcus sp.]|nr:site-specific integrase [Corallococcus sp.]
SLRSFLFGIFKYGQQYYDLPNVMHKVDGFRNIEPPKEMLFWTAEEFTKFIAVVDDQVLHSYYYTLYYTGCRKGEVQALTWRDIDFKNKTITINKSITRKIPGKAWAVVTPKNSTSIRKISIPDVLVAELKYFHAWQFVNYDKFDFVFCGAQPINEQYIVRGIKKYCELSKVKVIRQHDFRHSHASYLLGNGISITAVSKRLGHKNVTQTLDTYSHMLPSENDEAMRVLDRINSTK